MRPIRLSALHCPLRPGRQLPALGTPRAEAASAAPNAPAVFPAAPGGNGRLCGLVVCRVTGWSGEKRHRGRWRPGWAGTCPLYRVPGLKLAMIMQKCPSQL
ncbi:hypothetical protein GCM10027570_35580 [Streptomonospora sediminis]